MTSIAAIVCGHTLDRWADITNALQSVRGQCRPPDQIILSVDNNPELHAAAIAEFDDITVVHNTGTRGVSGARNVAARATGCDVLAYLDDDAVADERWLHHLATWYQDPNVLGVGGHAEPAWDGNGPGWFPPSFNWVVGCSHSGIADEPAQVRNFIGCNMSIRRSAWEAVGGFDESIGRVGADGGGGDETDFCIRVTNLLDGVIMNDPAAIVHHRVPPSRQTWAYFIKRCRSEGRSKAQIAAEAGSDQALSSERNHLLRELPRAFVRGFGDALTGNPTGLSRSAAIAVGTAATVLGYVAGRVLPSRAAGMSPSFTPIDIIMVDLALGIPDDFDAGSGPAMVVVRRGPKLLGVEELATVPTATELSVLLQQRYPADDAPTPLPSSDMTAAIVIATRDRASSLERALASLARLSRLPNQIIVVDNAPSDDTTQRLVESWRAPALPPVEYVRCELPGLARAHNAALPYLRTDIAAFTDDDVIVDPQWLDRLIVEFAHNPDVACVTGAILPAELETWPQAWVESTSNFTKGFETRNFSVAAPPQDPLFPFAAGSMGSGANMAFRTQWLTANPFNNTLGAGTTALGGDDLRAFYDVVSSGRELVYTPHAMVFHHHHRTAEAIERQARGYGAGLTAFLASVIADDPRALGRMAARAPGALRHARAITAPATGRPFPGERNRSRQQRVGMLVGPLRYLRSRF